MSICVHIYVCVSVRVCVLVCVCVYVCTLYVYTLYVCVCISPHCYPVIQHIIDCHVVGKFGRENVWLIYCFTISLCTCVYVCTSVG